MTDDLTDGAFLETRPDMNDLWTPTDDRAALAARHQPEHEYDGKPVCMCGYDCPCDTARALALLDEYRARLELISNLWHRGFREASWGHGTACNIHTKEAPGTGCTCVFGTLNAAIVRDLREQGEPAR